MSFSVRNNLMSLGNQKNLNSSMKLLNKAFNRLSSGSRINSAADDASGLAMAESMRADVAAYSSALRNANDGISVLNIADGANETTSNALMRVKELTVQAANGTLSDSQRASLNDEAQSLLAEIDRTGATTTFNGEPIQGELVIQAGIESDPNSQVSISTTQISTQDLGVDSIDLSTQAGAKAAMGLVDTAISTTASYRAEIGVGQSRLSTSVANIQTQSTAIRGAESTIRDADIAEETANMVKANILTKTGASLQQMSNMQPQMALKLLGGTS